MTYSPGTPEYQVNEYIERSVNFVTIPTVLLKRLLKSHERQRAGLEVEIERLRREMAAERAEIERIP